MRTARLAEANPRHGKDHQSKILGWPVNKFIDWAIAEKMYRRPRPEFECIDPENMASLPRDAFEDERAFGASQTSLVHRLPQPSAYLEAGRVFRAVGNLLGLPDLHFYGHGVPAKSGSLECSQIRTDRTFYYFDLRDFDARDGRVALKDLRNLKSNAAGRVVPIHPILIELDCSIVCKSFLIKVKRAFFPSGKNILEEMKTVRWSQPLSKSWQYVKKIFEDRARRRQPLFKLDISSPIFSTTKRSRKGRETEFSACR